MTCTYYVQHYHLFICAFSLPRSLVSRKTHDQPSSCSGNVINFDTATRRRTTSAKLSSSAIKASPSGIDEWPLISQSAVFFCAYAGLALATYPTTKLLETFSQSVVGLERWRIYVIESTLPILMGLVYLLGGIGHFVVAESFQDIYPPIGTWGIWYLPGSAAFHVAWTGVVELLGGAGLIFCGIRDAIGSEDGEEETTVIKFLKPICASVLFVLTILVTPANIYMFTHGAVMGDMAQLDMSFHYIRFAVQVIFLTLLFTLARDSFFYAWGDELD
ncbi:hypothetical protein ACHAXM_002589 [Skeletonema potamos]